MSQPIVPLDELNQRVNKLQEHFNYLAKHGQMNALTSAYGNYQIRNAIMEDKLRNALKIKSRPIKAYYYVYLLDQVNYPLVDRLQSHEAFELRVLVQTNDQIKYFQEKGFVARLTHSEQKKQSEDVSDFNDDFVADICFLEMPYGVLPSLEETIRPWMISGEWLPKYRDIFPMHELNNSLFCLVHYAYFLANEWLWLKVNPDLNVHYGLPLQNFAWLYFLESQEHYKFALERNYFGNTTNYVVTGYPKYDAYINSPIKPKSFNWRYKEAERKRIVYAPHFKRSDSTLTETCNVLLALADTDKYEVIFKPHPNYNKTVRDFIPLFEAHRNTQVVRNNDSAQYIFATSNLSIISSVSMHADGLFSGKPFISELSPENFNHIGREVQSVGYISDETTNIKELINDIVNNENDIKKSARDSLRNKLVAPNGCATENVINAILSRLGLI